MTGNEIGEGTRAHRAGARRYKWMTALFTAAIVGPVLAIMAIRQGSGPGSLSPEMAWVSALFLAAVVVVGTVAYFRMTDELDARDNLIAGAAGFIANAVVVIGWVILHFGDVTGPPNAVGALVAASLVAGIAYLGLKFGRR